MAHRLSKISLFVILAGILAVSLGCGGDDGSGMAAMMPDDSEAMVPDDTEAMMPDGTEVMMPDGTEAMMPVGLEGGLTRSPEPSVYADSAQDTLATLLPGGETVFSTLSSAMSLDYGMDTAAQPDQGTAYVKSISSDGMGGFNLISVFDGEEFDVHLEAGDYNPSWISFLKVTDDGQAIYALLTFTDAFTSEDPQDPAATDRTDGSSMFDYFDYGYWFHYQGSDAATVSATGDSSLFQGETRDSYVTYGVRTSAAGLPVGSATYEGTMQASWWDAEGDPDTNLRNRGLRGDLSLEANFDDGTISGRVVDMFIPGWNSDSGEDEPVGAISISTTMIEDAQFVADWVGENTDTQAAPDRTLSGFTGTVLAEFYGPAAEEVGGVLNGSRAATGTTPERFISGGFGASQPDAGQ